MTPEERIQVLQAVHEIRSIGLVLTKCVEELVYKAEKALSEIQVIIEREVGN